MVGLLPNELLSLVGEHVKSIADLNSLARCSHRFRSVLNKMLYQRSGDRPFFFAIQTGQENIVQLAIDYGSLRNESDVLETAIEKGHVGIIRLLLANSPRLCAQINTVTDSGQTFLFKACENGHLDVVRLLLDYGANVKAICDRLTDEDRYTDDEDDEDDDGDEGSVNLSAFYEAVDGGYTEIVQELLDRGDAIVDVRHGDDEIIHNNGYRGWPAISLAARKGHINTLRLLIDRGADIDLPTWGDVTALWLAAKGGHEDCVELLLQNGAVVPEAAKTTRELAFAAATGELGIIKLLAEHGVPVDEGYPSHDDTALVTASKNGHADCVKYLLEQSANPHIVTSQGHTPIYVAVRSGNGNAVQLLLEHGVDINMRPEYRRPLFFEAIRGRHAGIMELLIEYDPSVLTSTSDGFSPLHIAVQSCVCPSSMTWMKQCCSASSYELLLKHGACVNAVSDNRHRTTPLHLAVRTQSLYCVQFFLDHGADVCAKQQFDYTPLHVAAQHCLSPIVQELLDRGADPTAATTSGATPLHVAARCGHREIVELLLTVPEVHIGNADINGRTELFYAAAGIDGRIMEALTTHASRKGVSLNKPDIYGAYPVFAAVRHRREAVARFLLQQDSSMIAHQDCFGRNLVWWATQTKHRATLEVVREFAGALEACGGSDISIPEDGYHSLDCCWCTVCAVADHLGTSQRVCDECDGGNFFICSACYEAGMRCKDDRHELVPTECELQARRRANANDSDI